VIVDRQYVDALEEAVVVLADLRQLDLAARLFKVWKWLGARTAHQEAQAAARMVEWDSYIVVAPAVLAQARHLLELLDRSPTARVSVQTLLELQRSLHPALARDLTPEDDQT
jgi:hypothetical protein